MKRGVSFQIPDIPIKFGDRFSRNDIWNDRKFHKKFRLFADIFIQWY